MKTPLKKFITPLNLLIVLLLLFAFFLRIYRVNETLGFYYDQGRDALVIWDLIHKGKFFLIGPTTGVAGIFRGPFYYYLISPLYLLGGGDPVYPAIFLATLSSFAIWILYYVSKRYIDKPTAVLVAILSSLSFYIITASRWLSNPTPMLVLSALLIWMMALITKGKKWAWVLVSFIVGLSIFHFGSAGEIFYIPAVLAFAIWRKNNLPNLKIFLLSLFAFFITISPLVIFDLRHERILSKNIFGFAVQEKSFSIPSAQIVKERTLLFYNVFTNNIFHGAGNPQKTVLTIVIVSFLIFLPKLVRKDIPKILSLFLLSGAVGLTFFQGNNGVVYDYYLTGYFLPFVFLFGIVLGELWKSKVGKLFVFYFLYLFITNNLSVTWYKISDKGDNKNSVAYLNQKRAIDWVYRDANGKDFNVDVYVPPVIPYAYDYLFLWYPTTLKLRGASGKLVKEQTPLLYTLYEVDPSHPERLEVWLERQKEIGKTEREVKLGGITVQRRTRIKD